MDDRRYTDGELVDALLAGASWAAEEISRAITPIIRHRLADVEDWEDVRQSCVLRIIRAVRRADAVTNIWGLVHKVAVCHVINCNRRHRLHRKIFRSRDDDDGDVVSAGPVPYAADERLASRSVLLYVFQRIDKVCQRIFYLLFIEDRTYEETAQELGITTNNLRVRLHRCRARARVLRKEAV